MGIEIERKFLVTGEGWRRAIVHSETLLQGYLAGPPAARCSVRVRVAGDRAFLNVKSVASGISRDEYEYAIPVDDGRRMLATLSGNVVGKRRHFVEVDGHTFEIDEFTGDNQGLVVAEIELGDIAAEFPHPPWLGAEVSRLLRYYNLNLAAYPYSRWSAAERDAYDAT